jgi:hypothetical protein
MEKRSKRLIWLTVNDQEYGEYRIPCATDMVETDYVDVITEEYRKGQTGGPYGEDVEA